MFPCIKKSDLHNFADDNTITATYNTLGGIQNYIEKSEKLAIVNSFIYANFNYCPLVWQFSTCELLRKILKIQKRCLRTVLDDYDSDYDVLLRKSGKVTMEIKRLRVLVIEIFKTINNFNPNNVDDIFTPKLHPKVRPNDILVKHHNTITFILFYYLLYL